MAQRDRFADIKKYITSESPVIIDGGANKGTMTELFLSMYPKSKIYAFEPHPALAGRLQEKFGAVKNVDVHPVAIGAENATMKFNILNYENSSSLLKPSATNFKYHQDKMNTSQEVDVQVKRLDQVITEKEVDIMKLDLQGYELEALKGCEGFIRKVKVITTEIEFVPLYNDQPLFGDIDVYLRSKGFYLLNLYELYTQKDGQLTAGDAVYLNEQYFKR
ncbi:MAG: FkbM family methyltransferase [Bacteroidota bacterium]|nr:FkbM family methyltransferase [Bacteroidota bacterium]